MLPQRTRIPFQHPMFSQLVLDLLGQHRFVHKRRCSQPLQIRLILCQPIHYDIPRRDRFRIRDVILAIIPVVRFGSGVVGGTSRDVDGVFSGFSSTLAFSSATVLFCEAVFRSFVFARTSTATRSTFSRGGLREMISEELICKAMGHTLYA
jgi:hypothetical protein